MIGIIGFLIVVVLVNILTFYISNPIYQKGVSFINDNFWLLLLIAIILFVGAIFGAFSFPLNLPAPLIRAIGSVFCIAFLLRIFQWVDSMATTNIYPMFWGLSFLLVPLVFILVLASGYFGIMRQLFWQPRPVINNDGRVVQESSLESSPDEVVKNTKSWEEIGAEFRLVLYDLMHRFRHEIKRKE
jgi:peptidoglycan/LPS O-acetylase OafA/YrhL